MGHAARMNAFNRWKQEVQVDRNKVYDRFGREIREHDMVWVPGHDLPFRVSAITPDLSPQAPAPNIQQVALVAVLPIGVVGGRPINELVRIRAKEEYLSSEQLAQLAAMQDKAAAATEEALGGQETPTEAPDALAAEAPVESPAALVELTDK